MKQIITKITFLVAMIVLGTSWAKADAIPFPDGGVIELGQDYSFSSDFKDHSATITPKKSGALIQTGSNDFHLELNGSEVPSKHVAYWPPTVSYEVEAGLTYNVVASFLMSNGTLTYTMEADAEIEIQQLYPAQNSVYNTVDAEGAISIFFSMPVSCDDILVKVGNNDETSLGGFGLVTKESMYNITGVADIVTRLMQSGAAKEGDALVVTLKNIQNGSGVKYGTDGNLVLNYTLAKLPMRLVNSSLNAIQSRNFMSYYTASNPDGKFVFEFDGEVKAGVTAYLCSGDPKDQDKYYIENAVLNGDPKKAASLTIDGNKVIIDASCKRRDLSNTGSDYVTIILNNVRDLDGNFCASNQQGGQGSIAANMIYSLIEPVDVAVEYGDQLVPGSSLDMPNLGIWANNADYFNFEGISFTTTLADGTQQVVEVPYADCNVVKENNTYTLSVAVPEAAKTNPTTVDFYGLEFLDGGDQKLSQLFNQFAVKSITLTEGATYEKIEGGDDGDYYFRITRGEGYYIYGYFHNEENGEYTEGVSAGANYGAQLRLTDNGTYAWYCPDYMTYKMFTDFEPYIEIFAWENEQSFWAGLDPVASQKIYFKGSSAPFKYSDVNFVKVTPENNSTLEYADVYEFTFEYDGLVKVDAAKSGRALGMGTGVAGFDTLEAVGASEADPELSNIWKATINGQADFENFNLAVYATDIDGYVVDGGDGGKELSYLSLSYEINNPNLLRDLEVSPAPSTVENPAPVESLSVFTISAGEHAVAPNWNYTGEGPALYTRDRELIHQFTSEEVEQVNGSSDEVTWVNLTLPEAVTTPGSYVLQIPEKYFLVGGEFQSVAYGNNAVDFTFYVEAPKEKFVIETSPAAGAVENLNRVDFSNLDAETFGVNDYSALITVTNEAGDVVYSVSLEDVDANAFDMVTWTAIGYYIEPGITAAGTYTVHVPEDAFYNGNADVYTAALDAVFTIGGEVEPAQTLLFKWANVTGADDYVAEAGTVTHENRDESKAYRVNYANTALGVVYKTICVNGKKANLGGAASDNASYILVTFTEPLKEGDVISMTGFRNKENSSGASAYVLFDNETSTTIGGSDGLGFVNLNATGDTPDATEPNTLTYTITAENAGATSMKITRDKASTNLFITSLIVSGVRETEPDPIEPDPVEPDPDTITVYFDNTEAQWSKPGIFFMAGGYQTIEMTRVAEPAQAEGEINAQFTTYDVVSKVWDYNVYKAQVPNKGIIIFQFKNLDDPNESEYSSQFNGQPVHNMVYHLSGKGGTYDEYVSGVENVVVDQNAEAVYYNLQGARVDNPAAGQVYIVVRGNVITKELVK